MPIERSAIKAVLRTIPVEYFDKQIVNITYKPDAMTPARAKEIAHQRADAASRNGHSTDDEEDAAKLEENAEQLAEMLVSWDVVEDGTPLATTKENLMTFPNAFLGHILQAIVDDLTPKAKTSRR